MATLGKNQVFEIKNGDGTSFHNLVLRKSAVESIVMSLGDKISGDVYYKDNTLSVTMHEYITYNGVNYMLINPPTIVREGVVSDNSELRGMTKYSFVFYHPMCQLSNFPFTDVAVTNDETRYLSESKTFSWIGKPADFVAKMNKNLDGTEWIVEISSRFPQDKLNELSDVIPFDNATIADACKTFYDTWGVPYVVDKVASTEASYATGKRFKLVMGLPSNEIYENASAEQQNIPFVFQMGHGVGLKNNSRTPRNNKIITRISGYGSENNIPYGYPQVRWYGTAGQSFTYGDHAGVYTNVTIGGVHFDKVVSYPIYKGILNGEYVELIKHPFTRTHLMPSVYRTTLFNKISLYNDLGEVNTDYDPDITLVDYYDAIYSAQYPYPNTINLQAPSYESHEFEDEKPELGEAHIISATPLNNDLTPASSWDDSLDDEGNYKQSYFQMVLPQLSFDLYACASITEEMQINMRSGACLGCTFTVQVDWDDYKRNFYDEEGNFAPNGSQRDLTKYPKSNQGSISLVLQKDNSTFGTLMPNMYQYPKGETSSGAGDGDTFVILGISLPESYILAAEDRLDVDMKSYMLENNEHYFDYPLKFDEDFLFHNENILSQIRPNTVVRFNYAGQTQALFVKQITIKYGEQQLPQYDITLTDNVEVVLNQIGQVAEDVEKLSTLIAILRQSYGKNVWNELAKKLSKTQDDTAAGYITMLKGLQVGANFVPDILGEGGVLRMRDDGKVELVTDILYARVKAYFDSVEIREYKHTGGNRIASVAGNKICRVAWFNSSNVELEQTQANLASVAYFRCYFRASDGEDTVRNNWVVGDQAYCHITSIVNSSDNPEQKGLNQKHLWRLVIGRNTEGTLTEDNEAYIDLSNRATETISGTSYIGYQSGSDIPEAQDDIIQLGNVNDTTRQGAIVEFVTGTDAPSYQIYQGINSFSLNNKNQIGFGYNTSTGRAYLNVYGDAYVGARDRSTFIEYKQSGTGGNPELNIKAHVEFTNSDAELDALVQEHQRDDSYDDTEVRALIGGLQDQIDGQVESWFYDYAPVHVDEHGAPDSRVPLNVAPYSDWSDDNAKIAHLGDTFTDNSSGYCWRFTRNENTNAFEWTPIEDSAIISALQNAARAQDTADHKRRVFLTQPVPPYDAGDMWANAVYPANYTGATDEAEHKYNNDILKCVTSKASDGSFSINDWTLASKYTDDSKFNGYIDAMLNGTGLSGDSAAATAQKAILSALGVGTVVAGGLLLSSLIGMRQYNGSGDKGDVSNYTTWAGISGQYNANVLGGGMAAWYGGGMVDKETLSPEQISQGWDTLRWAKGVDRFDGSGYRANGNITWNANGELAISDITSIQPSGSNTNVLNDMIQFSNAFHFNTVQGGSTILNIVPQYPFYSLYLYDTSQPNNRSHVASQKWVDDHYITKTFFRQLFRAFKPNATAGQADVEVEPNTIDATISNIKAMVGLWTEQYVSALGQGSDGGGGGASVLYGLNDVSPNATGDGVLGAADGYVLTYNGSTNHWYAAPTAETYVLPTATANALGGIKIGYATSGKNYAVQLVNGQAFVNVPWENTTYTLAGLMGSSAIGGATQPIYWNGSAFENTTYTLAKSVPADAKFTDTTYSFSNADATLAWSTRTKIATTGGTDIYVTLPANPDTNTWRNIFLDGTEKLTTDINTKGLNFVGDDKTTISFLAAGTEEGQSGNANYATLKISSTWRGIQDNLTSDSTTDSLSAKQGKNLKSSITTLEGYFTNGVAKKAEQLNTSRTLWGQSFNGTANVSGNMTGVGNITMSANDGTYIKIGDIYIGYDSTNSAIEIYKLGDNNAHVAANLYAHGAISALGQGVDGGGGGGQGDVTWDLLAHTATDNRFIDSSYISGALASYSLTSHTHTTTIAAGASTDTSQLTLAHGTKYKLTAGGTSFVFTMPSGYSLPTASSSTLGGVKVGSTLAISSGVLNLATSGVTAGTYKRVTVDAYGRVTAGDDTDSNTWRNIYLGGTSKVGTGTDTKALNFVAGSNVTISYEAAGTGDGKSGSADYFNIKIAATDTTYSAATQSAAGLMSAADKKKLDGIAANANNYSLPTASSSALGGVKIGYTTDAANRNYAVQLSSEKMYVNVPWTDTTYSVFVGSGSTAAVGLVPKPSTTAGTTKFLREDATWVEPAYPTNYYASDTTRTKNTVLAAPNGSNGVATFRALVAADIPNLGAGKITSGTFDAARIPDLSSTYAAVGRVDDLESYFTNGVANKAEELNTSRSLWGQSFNGTADVSGNMSSVGDITFSASGKKIGNFLYFDTTNTRLGVNTSSPSYRLHVNGTFYASGNSSIGGTFGVTGATTLTGLLTANGGIAIASSKTLKIGDIYLAYDSTNNAIEVYKLDGTNHVAANLYARGGIAALGETSDGGGGGQGDVTWALLASDSDTRQIALSHLTTALSGYSTTSHTHTTTIAAAASGDTSQLTLAHGTKYKLTAGGTSYIFTMPSDNNSWRNVYVAGTEKLTTATNTKAINFVAGNNVSISFAAAGTGSGQSGNANYGTLTISATDTTYTLAGLMGSTAIGGTTQPIYWTGSAFANTSYTLGKSVPADAVFTDHYAWSDITNKPLTLTKNTTGFSISGGTTSKTLTVSETYTLGAACAKGVTDNSSSAAVTSSDTNLITGRTLYYAGYVKSSGVTKVSTSTGLTGGDITSTGTISINSTYQTYISHGESAYNSLGNYLPLAGGTMTGEVTMNWGSASSDQFINFKANDNIIYSIGIRRPTNTYGLCYVDNGSYYNVWHQGNLTKLSQLTNDSGYITSSGSCNYATSAGSATSATSAGNADTCDGLHVHTGRNNESDKIVRTDSSGHIQCGYINSSGDEANNSSPARVWGTNGSDSYMRTYLTSALSVNTANRVGDGTNYIYSTSNEVNFGGTYNTSVIEFGATAKDSKPKPTDYKFGGSNATASVWCNSLNTNSISSENIGNGTYNKMWWRLYSDHFEFEFPKTTDSSSGANIPIYMGWRGGTYALTITSTGDIVGMAGVSALSDARHKQVIRDTNLSVEQIANMPSVIFKWTDGKHDNGLHVGTLAQNWQQVLPEVVNIGNDKEHTLSLSYGVAALVAAITTARKVVDHEKRITELEKENKELREEISRLKIA